MECPLPVELCPIDRRHERRKAQNREAQRKFRSEIACVPLTVS